MDIRQIIKAIKPYVLEWIEAVQAQSLGAHNLSGTMHSGTLSDGQGPQFLKTDGSRQLTGDLTVAALKTIDGVDISVLGSNYTAHAGATAAAGHGSVGAHNHQTAANGDLLDHGAALSGLGDDDHTQYLNTTRHDTTTRHTLGTVVPHDDHGALSGLTDDDHTQYLNATRHNDTAHSGINHHTFAGLGDDDHTQYLLANGSRDVSGNLLPALTDTYDLGSSTKLWRKGYLSELDALVFSEQTIQLVGGWLMICKDQGAVAANVAAADTQIDFGKAMTPGDFVLFRGVGKVEYVLVGAVASGTRYSVNRNLDGSGANDWPSGAAFAVLGASGQGRIELNAYDTPRISVMKQGITYNANTELIRMGDLNGYGDYITTKYGLAIGEYLTNKANIVIDEDGILKFRIHNVSVMEFGGGNADITGKLRMPGATSAITIGATPPASAILGTGIWLDRTGFYGLASNVEQVKIDAATGKLTAGVGAVTLDVDGISIEGGSNDRNKLRLKSGANTVATIFSGEDYSVTTQLIMNTYCPTALFGDGITMNVYSLGGSNRVSMHVTPRGVDITKASSGSEAADLQVMGRTLSDALIIAPFGTTLPAASGHIMILEAAAPSNTATYGKLWYDTTYDWLKGINADTNNPYPLGVTQLSFPLPAWHNTSALTIVTPVNGNPAYQFGDSTQGIIDTDFVVPAGWGGRTVKITFWWYTAGAGNVVWGGELRYLNNGGSLQLNATSVGSVTAASANVIVKSTMNLNLPANVLEGQAMKLRFYRNGAHASDTRIGASWLLAIMAHII